jgi:hypothetical protein
MRLRSLLHPLGADPKESALSFFLFPSFLFFSSFCTKKPILGKSVRVGPNLVGKESEEFRIACQ